MTSLYYWLFTVARWIVTSLSYWLAVNCHLMNHCLSTCCRCQVFTNPSSSQAAFSPVRHTSPAMSINQSTNQCLYSHVSNKNTHGTRHDPESIHKHTRTDNERSSHVCAKHRIYYSKDEHCTYNNKLDKTQNAYRLSTTSITKHAEDCHTCTWRSSEYRIWQMDGCITLRSADISHSWKALPLTYTPGINR